MSGSKASVIIGIDVGGTHTDAVVIQGHEILGSCKTRTTEDVVAGVSNAVYGALINTAGVDWSSSLNVQRVHIGTTQFVNAVIQKKHLARIAVIRLCGPATTQLPPFVEFPHELKQEIAGPICMIDGGYHFDGQKEIAHLQRDQVESAIRSIKEAGIENIVVSAVFAPVNASHEKQIGEWVHEIYPEASVTLSHKVSQIDLLLRENSAILNQSLKPLAKRVIGAFTEVISDNLHCPFFLTQNDGTLLSADRAKEMPVLTFAAGPTNSMRGAAFLSGVNNAIVADIGGTSTDVGVLKDGFPRPASTKVQIGGVQTNFQMPDTLSIGLGGGSKVEVKSESEIAVGPDSVGYELCTEGLVFDGDTLTTTDIAVASGLAHIGTHMENVKSLSPEMVSKAQAVIHSKLQNVVNQIQTSAEETPLILVGGGSDLISSEWRAQGVSSIIKPKYYNVANAVGAALSQVSGTVDVLEKITNEASQSEIKERAKQRAIQLAIQNGADPNTVNIHSIADIPLTYLPGNVTRILVKAVGDLATEEPAITKVNREHEPQKKQVHPEPSREANPANTTQDISATGKSTKVQTQSDEGAHISSYEPHIDESTGEWILREFDVECIAIGAGILGCGGGGSPYLGKIRLLNMMRQGKHVRVLNPLRFAREAKEGDMVLPVAYMGAPTVISELLYGSLESQTTFEAVKTLYTHNGYKEGKLQNTDGLNVVEKDNISYIDDYKCPTEKAKYAELQVKALMSDEIGGCNSIEPLVMGAELDLPVLDCDTMGRAFPELQMCSHFINGVKSAPLFLGDLAGRVAVCLSSANAKEVENYFRGVCVEMGCSAICLGPPMITEDVTSKTVLFSLSRAWRLGKSVLTARKTKTSPIDAILEFEGGVLLLMGKVTDVVRKTEGGFAKGHVMLDGLSGNYQDRTFIVLFQNENLVVKEKLENGKEKIFGTVPDLLTLVDVETGEPIPTDDVRYGLRVAVLGLPAPPILTTPHALRVVGPQAFGYSVDEVVFCSVGEYVEHSPVPPV